MPFINTIPEDEATGDTKAMYDAAKGALGYIPNYTHLFSHRPDVMSAWAGLNKAIRNNMTVRRYELVTVAAARALTSSYCMMAHAGKLMKKEGMSNEQLVAIANDYNLADLEPAEVAMMAFAEKLIRDATSITQADVDALKEHGFTDAEIFDIAATAAARSFFSKLLDSLGTTPDTAYLDYDESLRDALTVGRAIEQS